MVSSRSSEPTDARRPKTPNLILRRIREQERHETSHEFADAMARVAYEMGESVYPTAQYVERLESGQIRYPRPLYRRILAQLCGRPFAELSFAVTRSPPLDDSGNPEEQEADIPGIAPPPPRINVPLRDVIIASRMEVAELERKVGVDPKSVQRWITRGRVPHPRNRRSLLILGLAHADVGRLDEAVAADHAALSGSRPAWPTMVLAGKLNQVLARDYADAREMAAYHDRYLETAGRPAGYHLQLPAPTEDRR